MLKKYKKHINYSVYLSKNTENSSEEKNSIALNFSSDQKFRKTKKLSLNMTGNNSKYSDTSS